MRDSLPAEARALTEERVEVAGTVEVSYEDHRGFSVLRHVLDTGTARYTLHFSTDAPGWTSGQQVRVRGVRVQNALALEGDPTPINAVSPALDSLAGEQRTLVMLVNFRDNNATPYTTAFASGVVFGTTDGYLRETSAGAVSLAGDVVGWFTINMDSTVCDTATLATLAKQAAVGAGTNPAQSARHVYAFPGTRAAGGGSARLAATRRKPGSTATWQSRWLATSSATTSGSITRATWTAARRRLAPAAR